MESEIIKPKIRLSELKYLFSEIELREMVIEIQQLYMKNAMIVTHLILFIPKKSFQIQTVKN